VQYGARSLNEGGLQVRASTWQDHFGSHKLRCFAYAVGKVDCQVCLKSASVLSGKLAVAICVNSIEILIFLFFE
jgi:hypothetical protein